MTKPVKDISASVKARLLNVSKAENRTFDDVMTMYMLERLLFRLSRSRFRNKFVLKGGLLLCVLFDEPHRTTKDIDFLAKQISGTMENIGEVFAEICTVGGSDGVVFDAGSIDVKRIKEDADYEGVRVLIICYLGKAQKVLQIDIGFGDIVVPRPQEMQYPVILDMESPDIWAYSLESIVAEKFEAMITLAYINSRMKDFYDIYMLSERFNFDGRALYEAINETFNRRGTAYEREAVVFTDEFYSLEDKQRQWMAFVNRTTKTAVSFKQIMSRVTDFLFPIYESLLNEKEFSMQWIAERKAWENYRSC
jgi:predicted nucleotidyltransferase component of viral defense system